MVKNGVAQAYLVGISCRSIPGWDQHTPMDLVQLLDVVSVHGWRHGQ